MREVRGRGGEGGLRMLQSGGGFSVRGVYFSGGVEPWRTLWEFSEMFEVC